MIGKPFNVTGDAKYFKNHENRRSGVVPNVPEKYQERAKARRRGAGTHQTAIRNFTIQIPKKKDAQQPSPPSITSTSPTTHFPLPLSNNLSEANEQAKETLLASNTPPEPIISKTTENFNHITSTNTDLNVNDENDSDNDDAIVPDHEAVTNISDDNRVEEIEQPVTVKKTRRVISRGGSRRAKKIKCYKFKPPSVRDKHGKIIKRAARVGVNTIDVIGETIYSTIIGYNDQSTFKKELQLFKEQVEVFLIKQTDLSDEHTLRESVYADEDTMEEDNEIKDSFESLLANITTRCGDLSISSSITPSANRNVGLEEQEGYGTLGIIRRFNNLLEVMDATIREATTNTENGCWINK
ncbi:13352_t:CDS:2 [Ambispora leptoticha]|uniref:13352_t:CDS:1 n=1 Tax=Ambispora leptoticha TaxID=144679 RepID=A0A9N9FCC9_9GLOM|nr:13352_t:CDS:2 [Ambispora leptoticha]